MKHNICYDNNCYGVNDHLHVTVAVALLYDSAVITVLSQCKTRLNTTER
jgi:hypothetical protein